METVSTGQVEQVRYVTVADAARILALKPWDVSRLLDEGAIEWCEQRGRRSVSVTSLAEYAAALGESA